LLLFPEGIQTNGEYIVPFKRGAFAGMNAVLPIGIKYETSGDYKL